MVRSPDRKIIDRTGPTTGGGKRMRIIAIALICGLAATTAPAGVISDIQQGLYVDGDPVAVNGATVTAATVTGFYLTEIPVAPYGGILVYFGPGHGVQAGDMVDVTGYYEEFLGGSRIVASFGQVTVTGTGQPFTPLVVDLADFLTDPDPYDGVAICLDGGLTAVFPPNQYGDWLVEPLAAPGEFLMLGDDVGFDPGVVEPGQCYTRACGVVGRAPSGPQINLFADGLVITDCTVPVESGTWSEVRALYR
jgi:hypothetical protein